jgi:hypothetical protein
MWINVEDRQPDKKQKYLVVLNCNGKEDISFCSWIPRKKAFAFDMAHINWKVIKWYDTDDRSLLVKYTNWLKNKEVIKNKPFISYELAEAFLESKVNK